MKNLFAKALFAVAIIVAAAMQSTAQESFAYQAVIRDGEGNLITNSEVELKFSLLNGGKTQYAETQKAKANQYGNISVMIGAGEKTEGDFAKVPWNTLDITLKVEVKPAGSDKFIELGQTKINPVPYAMYAAQGGGAAMVNGAAKGAETLFEVNDREGRPVFAVTNDGIVVYVDDQDSGKLRRSGFLVTGREASKGEPAKEYFSVTTDGTQIFVDEADDSKLRRSGFLVTGREATKNGSADYLSVDGNGTTVYVDNQNDSKLRRSGFLVTGREASKDGDTDSYRHDIFRVDGSLTTVYVEDQDGGKLRRSGFLVTGRETTKAGSNIVDITGSRTNLTTATLSIANSAATEEGPASTALQLTEETVTMNSDMLMDGGLRPALDDEKIEEMEEYKVWLSDSETAEVPDGYDYTNRWGNFEFYNETSYSWLGAFHDDMVVPLSTRESVLMFNNDGEETAIAEDAVVAVMFSDYGDIAVWPLAVFDDFTVSFAMTDYQSTSAFSGSAEEYARFNVTLNNTEPYAGCYVSIDGEIPYTAKITTSDRTFERDVIRSEEGYSNVYFDAVYGQKLKIEAADIPADKLFSHWLVNGRRYSGNPAEITVLSRNMKIMAVFKDESQKLWVDGSFKPASPDVVSDGSEDYPYTSIADALGYVAQNTDPEIGFRIIAKNINESIDIKAECKAHYITMDITDSESVIYQLKDNTTVPVIVRNLRLQPENQNDEDVVQVNIKGASLTLEGCTIKAEGDTEMHGAYVGAGELTLINTEILDFKAEQGAGVYVASGATLTVKGNRNSMSISGNTAEQGGGIYVANGATLNVSGGSISYNKFADEAENPAGADIYLAGEKAVFNLNPNGFDGVNIGKVGLAGGAMVTAVGEYPIYERYHGEPEETPCVASFDYIENIEKPLVKLGANVHPNNLAKISQCFSVVVRDLLAEGYSSSLNSEAMLFKFNRVYATGKMELIWENEISTNVNYTYFRNEQNNEYLYLKYMWNDSCEYRNYWIVDRKIYGDTVYLKIPKKDEVQPIYNYQNDFEEDNRWKEDWEKIFISEEYESDINLLGVQQIADGYDVGYEYGMTIFSNDENGNDMAGVQDNVVVGGFIDFFKNDDNLAIFKSLIAPSVSIEGRDVEITSITRIDWTPYNGYTLVGNKATSDGIVEMENYQGEDENAFATEKDVFEYREEPRKQTLAEVEAMFYDLKHRFTVTLATSLGGKIINNNTEYTGAGNNTFTKHYGDTIRLLARPDKGMVFSGWSDGVTDSIRTVGVCGHQNLTAKFSKEFYVSSTANDGGDGSADNPYKSIAEAVAAISEINKNYYYDINVVGELTEPQTISGDFTSNVITIKGCEGQEPTIRIPNGVTGSALTISTTVPVLIKNLTISGGNAQEKGGGIYCAAGSNVTLGNGTVVTGNKALYGGGVYVDGNNTIRGKLTMCEDSKVYGNEISNTDDDGSYGGLGVYVNNGEFTMNGGLISRNNGNKLNQYGALYLNNATFTMTKGKITSNTVMHMGANIYSEGNSVIIMNDGEISGGMVNNSGSSDALAGAIYLGGNTVMNMRGGVITDNKASAEGKTNTGGIVISSTSTFNMSGGTISGNKVESGNVCGNAIYVSGTFNISGSAYINVADGNDVYLPSGKTITVIDCLTHKAPVAVITPEIYSKTTKVLDGDYADLEGFNFNVTQEGDKKWFVYHGYLDDKYIINANNDDVIIEDPSKPYVIAGSQIESGQVNITLIDLKNGTDFDITFSNFVCDAHTWASALILDNQVDGATANFKITLDGENKLYAHNHGGFKLTGDSGAKSNVIFDTNPGEEATLEFKAKYTGTPSMQVENVTASFSLADGCSLVSATIGSESYDSLNEFLVAAQSNTDVTKLCILKIKRD